MSVAVATAVAAVATDAAVAASVGMWVQEVGCWSWILLPEILGLVLKSDHQLEGFLEERGPEVIMDVLHLSPHPVGLGCPGVGFHLHQLFNSSLQPLKPLNLLGYGDHCII